MTEKQLAEANSLKTLIKEAEIRLDAANYDDFILYTYRLPDKPNLNKIPGLREMVVEHFQKELEGLKKQFEEL